ncbi:hypothetical protein F0562_021491 [Nyssa sinensis]|uniref:CCHC-type domain-containing protein n=1 Tax=Nyssa sinensis TaxID=561372 RepID=A0A5J5BJV7_9ASTE|nr:hypothetical protein F0562_021491 [Nyssa sinensis]
MVMAIAGKTTSLRNPMELRVITSKRALGPGFRHRPRLQAPHSPCSLSVIFFRPDPDIDDDFREIYKEYTGPPGSNAANVQDTAKTNKRSHASSDEEEEAYDPNAVPTDFTCQEAKFWDAKSKATERNWKKRKEEEMICKICGESGHFTQGCPSTVGANCKSQDFFERVPAKEKHLEALFTGKVIHKIEKDSSCKIQIEERFIIVSGKDRLILAKGVDAVHKIKEEGDKKGSSSHMTRSRSPVWRSPVGSCWGAPILRNLFPVHKMHHSSNRGLADRIRLWKTMFVRICKNYQGVLHELTVMMELEVIQAIQNLQHVALTQATIILMMVRVWGP